MPILGRLGSPLMNRCKGLWHRLSNSKTSREWRAGQTPRSVPGTLPGKSSVRLQIPTLLLLVLGGAEPLPGQVLPPKTVPSPRGEQFLFLPTSNLGMGGLPIALDDPLGDPFNNPAVRGKKPLRVSLTPTAYGDQQGTIGGYSFPLSLVLSGSRWFGTLAAALQSLEDDPKEVFSVPSGLKEELEEKKNGRNRYILASIGRQLGPATNIGLKVVYADLGILDGERRLYPSALSLSQTGHARTVTMGAEQGFREHQTVRVTVSNSHLAMSHGVTGWRRPTSDLPGQELLPPELWTREGGSRSDVWEGTLRYSVLIPGRSVRIGAMASVWARDQSRVPRYDWVHIPRDPGTSTIGELGVGVQTVGRLMRLALEVAVAPGTAHTLLLSDSTIMRGDGTTIQPGDPILDNDFRFRNWRAGVGADVPVGRGGFQVGLGLHRYSFRLRQRDLVWGEDHDAGVSWTELVPSIGGGVGIGPVEVGYSLRLVNRGFSPCADYSYRTSCQRVPVRYHFTGMRAAPTLPDDLPDFRLTSHQLTFSIPVG